MCVSADPGLFPEEIEALRLKKVFEEVAKSLFTNRNILLIFDRERRLKPEEVSRILEAGRGPVEPVVIEQSLEEMKKLRIERIEEDDGYTAMSLFGKTLRRARKNAGLTLKNVAEAMGWSIVYLSDVERGRRNPPKPEMMLKLAQIVGVPAGVLLEAAAKDWGFVSLPLEGSGSRRELFLLIAREWDNFTEDVAIKVIEVLRKILSKRKGSKSCT
ncbi:helix-turn-helix domain-containing protein [Thermosulfurimonas sp. F29]|uniref:helix-turn-helix domain-containing protein n=1 Tax=Thermosulfurimonas sp. F29 TaxID=2867247 RepID=UPI001C837696|nr:helix-turn-helix transcriptional regulator [Thermosulfurimonas sp. F29]MBX6423340.1 helix-turn-helix domain-containing protein [Thermosulfurimonas sp. F29]